MAENKEFSIWKVLLPVAIGLLVVALMFWHDAKTENFVEVWGMLRFDARSVVALFLILVAIFGREFGYTWRYRMLTDNQLSWKNALQVDMLCEFTSCITPSSSGGSSVAMFFLGSKGIELGRATSLVMVTLLLDTLFFVVVSPIVSLLTHDGLLFACGDKAFSAGIRYTFWICYGVLCLWAMILYVGLLWKPTWIRRFIAWVFRLRMLRRWSGQAESFAEDMVATSHHLHSKRFGYWIKAFVATAISWTSRFLVVNILFYGFLPADDAYQWVIFARDCVIWVILMFSPTPGGSGLSEWLFSGYYGDLVPIAGVALLLAIFWRVVSYYIYLIVGAIIVPGWVKNTYSKIRHKR